MFNEKIYVTRIERFRDEIADLRFYNKIPLRAEYIFEQEYPISYHPDLENFKKKEITSDGRKYNFKKIVKGEEWGKTWGSGWFRFTGEIPEYMKKEETGILIDLEAEGCVFRNGEPWQGLTNKIHWNVNSAKRLVFPDQNEIKRGEIFLLVETGANGLFGAGQEFYRLKQAEICCINREAWKLYFDLEVIASLISKLPERSTRRQKLIRKTNDAINEFHDGKGIILSLEILAEILAQPANASSLTAYSIGHAHLDLGWLWPIRETRRKGGRTFSTALRLMDEYPKYRFGASQPQLYEWIKEDYPRLYKEVQEAVKKGKWECQGAMWVEPDMNITGGESLVRQCFYGQKWWQDEFELDIDHLWLPDVFGYSAALPQILRKSGVKFFMTQKISWNETNLFPHHTFIWEGIDGTGILTHFLPANDYNCSNLPRQLIEAEERFAQNDITDEFLNLYGIGDGGGGPSRIHIELGLRQQNLEGTPRFKFALAHDYFKKLSNIPQDQLPVWKGELYLELHRGTYTTQAYMKKLNRQLELELRDIEMLGAWSGKFDREMIDRIWKNTLLNQFHDILPGSSIKKVYQDAHALSEQNLLLLHQYKKQLLNELNPATEGRSEQQYYQIFNTLSWSRHEIVILELPDDEDDWEVFNGRNEKLFSEITGSLIMVQLDIPALGYSCVVLKKTRNKIRNKTQLTVNKNMMENELLRIEINDQGVITGILDKELNRDTLAGEANLLLLYEDKPNNWEAWDINHYYRDTIPEQAKLETAEIVEQSALTASLKLCFTIGNSRITQILSLNSNEKTIRFWNLVNWQEKNKMLRVRCTPDIKSSNASFEIQYGLIKRPTHNNTSWDQAMFEVCAQRFADLSQTECGFALINDCKYGYYVKDNVMELNLLRSTGYPDDSADIGEHVFNYAYLPHKGDLQHSDVLQQAHNFNNELLVHNIENLPEPREHSYLNINGKNVKLETIKPAANGVGMIIRLYEFYGTESCIRLSKDEKWAELRETDLLEKDLHLLNRNSRTAELDFSPFEIRTFRIIP